MNPLAVLGSWTFPVREELRERGFQWNPYTGQWLAPSEEAKNQAILDFAHLPTEWAVTLRTGSDWREGKARCVFLLRSDRPPERVMETHEGTCKTPLSAEYMALIWGLRAVARDFGWPADTGVLQIRARFKPLVEELQGVASPEAREAALLHQELASPRTRLLLSALPPSRVRLEPKHVRDPGKSRSKDNRTTMYLDGLASLKDK